MSLAEAARVTGAELGAGSGNLSGCFQGCGTDSRRLGDGELFFALRGPRYDGHDFLAQADAAGAAGAVVELSRAPPRSDLRVPMKLPLLGVPDCRAALGALAADWRRRFELPLVAVTGSNGKTTVKELLGSILGSVAPVLMTRGNLNNDIGVPLTLFELGPEHRSAVLELGAGRPGDLSRLSHWTRPRVVLITQCAPAHLEGLRDLAGVAAVKAEIFAGMEADGTAVLNADDVFIDSWRCRAPGRVLCFGLAERAEVSARAWRPLARAAGAQFLLCLPGFEGSVRLALCGKHNLYNALAAAAAAHVLGVPGAEIVRGLASCRPAPGRLQPRQGPRGSLLLDDSYNANPGSLRAALEVLTACAGRRWLVLGDMHELGPSGARLHEEAGRAARAAGVERLYCVGDLAAHAAAAFGAGASCVPAPESVAPLVRDAADTDLHVLVKGSRLAHMERLVESLVRAPGALED